MDLETGYRIILLHAGYEVAPDHPGILGNLRPLVGVFEKDFAEIIEAMVAVFPLLSQGQSSVDKQLIAALWELCERIRVYSAPNGMLQHNKLITQDEADRLNRWAHILNRMTSYALDGSNLMSHYLIGVMEYIGWQSADRAALYEFLRPEIEEAAASTHPGDWLVKDMANEALRALNACRSE